MKASLLFLILIISFATQAKKQKVVATVNGVKIYKAQLEQYHAQNLKFVSQRKITRKVSLNDLINKILGTQKAKKQKLDKNPFVREKMDDILYHAQISRDLEKDLLKIKVKDDEVKSYYNKNPEYRTAQILYRISAQPDKKEVTQGLEKISEVYKTVSKKPKSFSEIARNQSQSASAFTGGDMGFLPGAKLAPEYYEAINGKYIGFITKPIRTQYGFHVIKVLGKKNYDQIEKNMYKKIIYDIKRDKILNNYFASMRNKAKININKEHL